MVKLLFRWADGFTLVEWVDALRVKLSWMRELKNIHYISAIEILEYAPR